MEILDFKAIMYNQRHVTTVFIKGKESVYDISFEVGELFYVDFKIELQLHDGLNIAHTCIINNRCAIK